MELLGSNQYNQGIGKNKLLSATAGVGSIITTRIGGYILVSDINKWIFVRNAQKTLEEIRSEEIDNSKRYQKAKLRLPNQGISFIDDWRFVEFLREEKELKELVCLIAIPSLSLSEQLNTPNWKNHPINKRLDGAGKAEDFMVRATHFPKWFRNDAGELKPYAEWKSLWIKNGLGIDKFVPPRDALKPILDSKGNIKTVKVQTEAHGTTIHKLYATLSQSNLILICPNGHLSDIPWPKFLKWKSSPKDKNDTGHSLLIAGDDCCSQPKLKWTESKTKSEGYGSIFIECTNCGTGTIDKINLEGINNLKPTCAGHKPWELDLSQDGDSMVPYEPCFKNGDLSIGREQMQVALVTGNNVYYANTFSSIYIPQSLVLNKSQDLVDAMIKCNEKFEKYAKVRSGITKTEFWDKLDKSDFIIENGFAPDDEKEFIDQLKATFLESGEQDSDVDRHENYKWQEYQCFCGRATAQDPSGLRFNDIQLPEDLSGFFSKIQQVEELKVSQVQLDFTRVKPKERIIVGDEVRHSAQGKNIFSTSINELYALPANETFGEGIFLQLNEAAVNSWILSCREHLQNRFAQISNKIDLNSQGASMKQRIQNNGFKHYLIHSLSHIIMRELEFTCGYPTASLKERLYISNRMSGLLVYTAEGSEGSMGGLIWQARPDRIKNLIVRALRRSIDCSSDPLCWESEGQGVFDLNLAACFSCSLVSETACEELNLGLDRRVLIDDTFGFFRSILP